MARMNFGQTYASSWNAYIRAWRKDGRKQPPGKGVWPGDQWGTPASWQATLRELVLDRLPEASRIVEIGPGSGKYTKLMLDAYPGAEVWASDVSADYLEILRERLAAEVEAGRVLTHLIGKDHDQQRRALESHGWLGAVDCVCSFDALCHVDLGYLAGYLRLASQVLRPGGILSTMVADATSDAGHAKLMTDIRRIWPYGGKMCQCFQWVSPDIMTGLLGRLGFVVELLRSEGAYLYVVARRA